MIKFFDISRQNMVLAKELDSAIKEVIKKGNFILGEKVTEFEREFAKYIGVKYAVGVASGTDAISLALSAVGVGRGGEVIMPANAYPSVFAVTAIGAIPKLVDINPATYNIDSSKIEKTITDKTKAILPVHLYGQPAEMGKILEIGKKHNIPVVEDCAQAVGAEVKLESTTGSTGTTGTTSLKNSRGTRDTFDTRGTSQKNWKKVGTIGDVGCFSFYPTKNLGCFGDGGMVVTDNEEIYKRVRLLRMYGEVTRYNSVIIGRNSRLDELQAAILLVKIKYLDRWNERRREIAHSYKLCKSTSCKWPQEALYTKHVYHLLVIRTKKRDKLKKYLEEKGIGTAIHYPVPIHLVPSMKFLGYKKGDFPESERACEEVLSLPMYPELTDNEIKTITQEIHSVLK